MSGAGNDKDGEAMNAGEIIYAQGDNKWFCGLCSEGGTSYYAGGADANLVNHLSTHIERSSLDE